MAGWIAYLTVALVWGSTYFAIRVGLGSFTPYGMVCCRFLSASVLMLLLGRLRKEPLPSRRDLPHLALVGLMMLGVSNGLVTWSETYVSSGVAAVLCALVPVFLALFDAKANPLGGWGWTGLAIGLTGIAVLVDPFEGAVHLGGVALLITACLSWSYATLHGKRHVKGTGMMTNVGVEMLAAGLAAFLVTRVHGGILARPLTMKAGLAVGYLAVFGSAVAFTAYVFLAKAWPAGRMGTYAYLNPLVAVLLGCAFLGEPFNLRMGLGMAVTLAGVALVQFKPKPNPKTTALQARPAAERA